MELNFLPIITFVKYEDYLHGEFKKYSALTKLGATVILIVNLYVCLFSQLIDWADILNPKNRSTLRSWINVDKGAGGKLVRTIYI